MTSTKTDKHGYPTGGFFVAHKLYTGYSFPREGSWGDVLDGPMTDDEAVIEALLEAWSDSEFAPDRDDLRVWHIVPGKVAEDCTDWAIKTMIEAVELRSDGL